MNRKLRTAFTIVLAGTLALPAIASTGLFPDVPEDHPRADAIRWAKEEGIYRGFPDGNFRPDEELTETQFIKTARRLYDHYDSWTRADWAQVVYKGLPSLSIPPTVATTTTTENTGTGTAPPATVTCLTSWPLGAPYWITEGHTFQYPVSKNTCRETFTLVINNERYPIRANDILTPVITWRNSWPTNVRMTLETSLGTFGWTTLSHTSISYPTTTTVPGPVTPRSKDRQLRVAIVHDEHANFIIHWVRPGWESMGWKWRLWTTDTRCSFTNGVSEWNTSRVGRGYANFLLDDGGLCVRTARWQIEIVFDNNHRFVSDPCVRRTNRWYCNTPAGWQDWPNYSQIPPTASFLSVTPWSVSDNTSSFDVNILSSRRAYYYIEFCGLKQGLGWLDGGENSIRLVCDLTEARRRLVIRFGFRGQAIINRMIDIPKVGKDGLSVQRLSPKIQVTVSTGGDRGNPHNENHILLRGGNPGPGIIIDIAVMVGDSDLARKAKVTYYESTSTSGWGTDVDGNRLLHHGVMENFNSGSWLQKISTGSVDAGTTFKIQVHEPNAATHHLSYTFVEGKP